MRRLRQYVFCGMALAVGACAGGGGDTPGNGGAGGVSEPPIVCTAPAELLCEGDIAVTCKAEGDAPTREDCAEQGLVCAAPHGCRTCWPGSQTCVDGVAQQCDAPGNSATEFACGDPAQGMSCELDGCKGPCSPDALTLGNVGCDFYPTVTANGVWRDWFRFAVVVANNADAEATVTITRGALSVESRTVAAGSAEVIELPWVPGLKGPDATPATIPSPPSGSRLEDVGAYRVRSTLPVSVYQFSAFRYENPEGEATGCPTAGGDGCFSYTNDASILLPAHALTSNYTVIGYRAVSDMQEFVSITATTDATVVEVRPSANILAGEGVTSIAAGDLASFTLDRGDVLQLFTADGDGAELSGTQITALDGKPIQVLSGIPSANIPSGTCCSDHIEEVVPPVETMGKSYLVGLPRTPDGGAEAPTEIMTVRVHAVFDDTRIVFDPPVLGETVLNQGEVVELSSLTSDVAIDGDKPFAVTQYMHSQADAGAGDPSQGVVIPTEQFRERYVFAAPKDYDLNRVNIVAPAGANVVLDGTPVPAGSFFAVGTGGYGVARVALSAVDIHTIEGDLPFGIYVYGYGAYTSFMYPGGMQLEAISDVPPPK